MERRIVKHSSRLSAALDQQFAVGQRVRTLDGAIGRIILVTESFAPGNEAYQVILDSGQGGGTYLASQLRPVGEDYGGGHQHPAYLPAGVTAALETEADLDEHEASLDYPEMGSILSDRPDPAGQITVVGHYKAGDPYERDDPDSHNYGWCHACKEHHASYEEAEEHENASTDWRRAYKDLPPRMYRGMVMKLTTGLHEHVHDPDIPVSQRAEMLNDHLRHYWQPLGMHWTPAQSQAEHYAEVSSYHGYKSSYSQTNPALTHVVVHAAKPKLRDIEKDPDILNEAGVIGHEYHEDAEIPLQGGAPVTVTGLSWKRDGDTEYTHHSFRAHREHVAATYADGFDPRDQDYNGEPQIGGVYWGAPAQQQFVDDELGQPEPGPAEVVGPEPEEEEPEGEEEPGPVQATAAGLFPWNTPEGQKHMVFHMMHRHKYRLMQAKESGGDIWDEHRALHEQGGQSHDHDWALEERFQPMQPLHKKLPMFKPELGGGSEHPRPTPTGLWRGGEIPEDHPLYPHWEDFRPRHTSDDPRAVFSSLRAQAAIPGWMERGIMADPKMSAEDREFMAHVFDHIRRGAPASEPIDAEDAMTMARGHRTRDLMEDSGWELSAEAKTTRYPRGFNLHYPPPGADSSHDLTHMITLTPNHPKGWHVRTWIRNHPMGATHIHHDLDAMDDELPGALHEYVNHPQIAPALAEQRAQAAGARTASLRDDKSDRWHEYNQQFRPDTLHRGIHVRLPDHLHDYVHDESIPREDRARALAEHFADRGGLGQHWTPHTQIAHRAIWNAADAARSSGAEYEDEDNPEYNIDDWMEDHPHGDEDEDYGEEHEPRPTHTDVMFHVNRPGRRNEIRDPRQLEQHEVGWQYSKDEAETFLKDGSPLRLEGISWKPHEPEYPNEPFEHVDFSKPIRHTARVPWTPQQRTLLHSWQERPTATTGDFVPSNEFTNRLPEPVPEPDPETEFAEAVGPRAFTMMTAARRPAPPEQDDALDGHQPHDPAADEVYGQLAKKFPPESISWVHDARWEGPHRVPLDQIDFGDRDSWEAQPGDKKVRKFQKKITRKEDKGKDPKPAVLVAKPSSDTQTIADGHHRALAEEALEGEDPGREGLWAWTAHVPEDEGPWDQMHSSQEPEQGDALDEPGELAPGAEAPGQEAPVPGGEDTSPFEPGQPPGMPPPVMTGLPPMSQSGTPGPRTKNMTPVEQSPSFQLAHPELQQQQEPPGDSDDTDDTDEGDDGDEDTGPALDALEKSAGNASFRFEFTSAWRDVVAKAERIVRENGVRITALAGSLTVGEVKGDHATYETGLQYYPGRGFSVMAYSCGCPWASFHQDPDYPGRFAGRMCSHAYALSLAAKARGVVRRTMFPETEGWPEEVVTKSWPPWHPSDKAWAQEWRAPMTTRPVLSSLIDPDSLDPQAVSVPAVTAARVLVDAGEDPAAVLTLLRLAGFEVTSDQANAPWGSQDVADMPPQKPYGATDEPDPDMDPGSYGFLAGPDPDNWGQIDPGSAIQQPLTNEAAKDDSPVLDQPDIGDWAEEGQTFAHEKREGARIFDNSAGRSGRGASRVSRQGMARQGTGPVPDTAMDTNTGPVTQEWGEGFPRADVSPSAGPATAVSPHDPAGIRMEETLVPRSAAGEEPYRAEDPEDHYRDFHNWKPGDSDRLRGKGIDPAEYHRYMHRTYGEAFAVPHDHLGMSERDQLALRDLGIEASLGEPQPEGALAELKDEPDAALDPEGLTADYAAQVGEGISGQAQHPDQFTTQEPGMGSMDEPLAPGDSSIQSTGQQQWSGVDYNSADLATAYKPDEHEVEPESMDDVVASFQRSAAARQYSGDAATRADADIAGAARDYLAKTADVLPAEEADELIREGRGTRARNLDLLDLEGTHYTDDPGLDDHDDDVLYA